MSRVNLNNIDLVNYVKTILFNKTSFSLNFSHYLLVFKPPPRKKIDFSLKVSMYPM